MSLQAKYIELFPGQRQIGQLATSADKVDGVFHIWVLPEDAAPKWVTSFVKGWVECGSPGATLVFGPDMNAGFPTPTGFAHKWFHIGPWQDDFKSLVDAEGRKQAKQALEPTNVLARYKRLEVQE